MIHPYWGQDFIGFFVVLFTRLIQFFSGQISAIAIDEAQILVLGLTGITGSLMGSLLVYRKMTMLANSISHTILLGVVVSYILGFWSLSGGVSISNLLAAALITSFLTTESTNFFVKVLKVQKDASIGLIFTTFLAIGIILVTVFTKNAHIGAELILGNIDLLQKEDIFPTFLVAISTLALVLFFYKPFIITTFDPLFGKSLQIGVKKYDQIIMVITSSCIVCSFRVVGVALVLALLVIPPMIARLFTHKFSVMIGLGSLVTLLVALFSVAITRACLSVYGAAFSTSGMMVSMLFMFYLLAAFIKKLATRLDKSEVQ
ncbi:MAG: metal ABC transporter permease [Chlamydiae bacterium]|nr:metal ABC transporter permease [Chlamydiota bacterium]